MTVKQQNINRTHQIPTPIFNRSILDLCFLNVITTHAEILLRVISQNHSIFVVGYLLIEMNENQFPFH